MAVGLLILVAVVIAAASVLLMKGGMSRTRSRTARAAAHARTRLAAGEALPTVTQSLATEARLPPLAAVRALSDASDITPTAALGALRPFLSARALDLIDRTPTDRFNRAMQDLAPN